MFDFESRMSSEQKQTVLTILNEMDIERRPSINEFLNFIQQSKERAELKFS